MPKDRQRGAHVSNFHSLHFPNIWSKNVLIKFYIARSAIILAWNKYQGKYLFDKTFDTKKILLRSSMIKYCVDHVYFILCSITSICDWLVGKIMLIYVGAVKKFRHAWGVCAFVSFIEHVLGRYRFFFSFLLFWKV